MPRKRLKEMRSGKTHEGVIYEDGTGDRVEIFITVNTYPDGRPAELFVRSDQHGGTRDGFCDAWSTAVSLYWQMGGDVNTVVKKFSHQNFAPFGRTEHPEIKFAKSIVDYVARWIALEFGDCACNPKKVIDQPETVV